MKWRRIVDKSGSKSVVKWVDDGNRYVILVSAELEGGKLYVPGVFSKNGEAAFLGFFTKTLSDAKEICRVHSEDRAVGRLLERCAKVMLGILTQGL